MATGVGNNSFNVSKSLLGSIHIVNGAGPSSGDGRQAGITFMGSSASEAQAGIYVGNNNSAGTYMGFATTDSYATGPQLFMSAYNGGYVYFHRSYVEAAGSFRAPIFYDSANTAYYFDGSATGDSIRVAGDVVAYYSDERLKDIKCNISDALSKVMTLNGFYYEPNKIAQSFGYEKKLQIGLSAQQVETVLPEVIKDAPIGNGYKTLDYSKLVPLLIEAIKEQQKQIDELKTKLK
jgi:hypothetical protein